MLLYICHSSLNLLCEKKINECGKKKIPIVLLHSVIIEVTSEEHSKHIFPVFFLFYEENKTSDIGALYGCLCAYVHIASVIIF